MKGKAEFWGLLTAMHTLQHVYSLQLNRIDLITVHSSLQNQAKRIGDAATFGSCAGVSSVQSMCLPSLQSQLGKVAARWAKARRMGVFLANEVECNSNRACMQSWDQLRGTRAQHKAVKMHAACLNAAGISHAGDSKAR